MEQPRPALVVVLVGVLLGACTIENPRLCAGRPCFDLSAPDLAAPADLTTAMERDGAACACGPGTFCVSGRCEICDRHDHCGMQCGVCVGSAHPSCSSALRCTCVLPEDCGSGTMHRCESGVCTRSCLSTADCATAPAGKACLGLTERRCGCDSPDDCPPGSACQGGACACGVTVCRQGQRCLSGVCQ